eukprot:jgi/Ulvmu1/8749/UM048_0003.1
MALGAMDALAPAASCETFIGSSIEVQPLKMYQSWRSERASRKDRGDGPAPPTSCQHGPSASPRGSQPRCTIHTHISQGGLITTIYRCGPSAPPADPRFPELDPDPPTTSRRHNPPRGLRPPPRTSVPHLPSLSSREPAETHWTCHVLPSSPVSTSCRRHPRRLHSPTSSIISPSPAALAPQESMDLQLPPSFPLYSQYSGTFFSPEALQSASVDDRTDHIRLSTSTLLQQVEAEMEAARTICDAHACEVFTSGTDWHVEVHLHPTPRERTRSVGSSPRGVAPAATATPVCHSTLPRVDEHEAEPSPPAARPSVARRLDFEKLSPAAQRLLDADGDAEEPSMAATAADEVEAAEGGKADRTVVPPLYPETPKRRFQNYLQQLRDDRPSLEARTATTVGAAVDSTATITPRDTARWRPATAGATPSMLREADADSDCSETVELSRTQCDFARAQGALRCSRRCAGGGNGADGEGQGCSAWSLDDDTSDMDVITTRTVSEHSWHASPAPSCGGPPGLAQEPRVLWRRRTAGAR